MICRRLDRDIAQLAARERCYFTRYADDLTFSTDRTRFPVGLAYLEGDRAHVGAALGDLITASGFRVNGEKTRLVRRSQRQRVTGLVVNRQLNVPRTYIREVRALIYVWERYGLKDAEASLSAIRRHLNRAPRVLPVNFQEAVTGKVQYIGSVKGWHDPIYTGLADRLAALDPGFAKVVRKHEPRSMGGTGAGRVLTRTLYVCTEGETDVTHLKAAMTYFHGKGEYQDLALSFDSESVFKSDTALAKHLKAISAAKLAVSTVCLFDRDNESLLREMELLQQDYKIYKRGAAGVALVTPAFRKAPFCIELLFRDADLLTCDASGRRIYTKSEFVENTGQHKTDRCAVRNINTNQLIRDDVYEFETQKSLALSKIDFARLVAERQGPFAFDFDGFRPTIEMLRSVARELDARR